MVEKKKQRVFRFEPQCSSAASPRFDSIPEERIIRESLPSNLQHADISLMHDVVVPSKLMQVYGGKLFPQIFFDTFGWVYVSESVREIVENLESGVHGFTPEVKVFYKDGNPSEEKYYGLAWGEDLKGTIIVEKSEWKNNLHRGAVQRGEPVPISSGAIKGALAIDKNVVLERHLWRTPDYGLAWFGSGELIAAFKKAKVRGLWTYEQVLEER